MIVIDLLFASPAKVWCFNNFVASELLNWSLKVINVPKVITEKIDDKNKEVCVVEDIIFFFSSDQ